MVCGKILAKNPQAVEKWWNTLSCLIFKVDIPVENFFCYNTYNHIIWWTKQKSVQFITTCFFAIMSLTIYRGMDIDFQVKHNDKNRIQRTLAAGARQAAQGHGARQGQHLLRGSYSR